ncbi:MAG: M48 family metalloprotease [Phycisphaerales bacterium]|nr:M48 family metalloprotease [Phycisphaerales bacterium]
MHRVTLFLLATALTALGSLSGCTTNAATGRTQFAAYSRADEIALGTSAMPSMVAEYGGAVSSAPLRAYVSDIGNRLAAKTEADNPTLPWEFTLLDSAEINAFAMPGGKVFVARGLVEKMTNEAQLAGVIGHEIGHVTARHISEQIGKQTGVQIGAAVLGAAVTAAAGERHPETGAAAGVAIAVGGQLVTLKFSRDQETEADHLGLRYMSRLNYNPAAMDQVMAILEEAMGSGRQPELLATHPDPASRRVNIAREVRTTYASTQNNPKFVLNEERFRTQFLNPLKALPPARAQRPGLDITPAYPRAFALNQPATWCAHCAGAEQAGQHGTN